jgi:hypothetical protein
MRLSKESINLGTIPLQGVYKDEILIEDGLEDFHYMKGSCYCTSVKKVENKILVEFTPSKTIAELKKGERKFKPAFVYIWLNPNEPEFLVDDSGIKVANENKKQITIPINYTAVG